jgi:hypothetical protein
MRDLLKLTVAAVLVAAAGCSDDSDPRPVEAPYAAGQVTTRVVNYSSRTLVLDYDFILYDEKGMVDASKFALTEGNRSITGGGTLTYSLKSLTPLDAQPRGCYSTAVLMEQNAMERPDRPEQLARYIFKNTPSCSNFSFSVYPERDAALGQASPYKIYSQSFINDDFKFDQDLAIISANNRQLYEQQKDPYNTQLRALEAVTRYVVTNSGSNKRQVFAMYQNFDSDNSTLATDIQNYAVANNIVINAVKNDFSSNDVLFRMAHATGGLYFMPDDFDPFHQPAKSDYYAIALHADKFMSGNYKFYRARYEITASVDFFKQNFNYYLFMGADFGNDNLKRLPFYVPIR